MFVVLFVCVSTGNTRHVSHHRRQHVCSVVCVCLQATPDTPLITAINMFVVLFVCLQAAPDTPLITAVNMFVVLLCVSTGNSRHASHHRHQHVSSVVCVCL